MNYRSLFAVVSLVFMLLILTGSSCQVQRAMTVVRQTHSGLREGFVLTDTVVARLIDAQRDTCFASVDSRGLTGQAGMTAWTACMESLFVAEDVLDTSRGILAEMEAIYVQVEAGTAQFSNWQRLARDLLTHARRLIGILTELSVDVPAQLTQYVASLCQLVHCEEE